MNPSGNSPIARAWYRPDQWALLRAVSTDGKELEKTYEEWLALTSARSREWQAQGLEVLKIDVELGALVRWCKSEGRPVDAEARAEYALKGVGPAL